MLTAFAAIAANWRLALEALLGAALAVTIVIILVLRGNLAECHTATAEAQLAPVELANQVTVNTAKLVEADQLAGTQAVATSDAALQALTTTIAPIREEVIHAPPTDDGPVAPVLQRAGNSLRQLSAPAAGHPD